jgi:hypothetical protein
MLINVSSPRHVLADDDGKKGDDGNKGDDDENGDVKKGDPLGAWFGIARPCPASAVTDSPVHAAFCTAVCGACANPNILPPEISIIPTLLADGTLLTDDALEIGLNHTTAHGAWMTSENDGLVARPGTQRLKGTFFSLGQTPPNFGLLGNGVRTRFVTYFDPKDPDRMIGYIQPYSFPIAAGGAAVVNTPNPLDPLAGNHTPTIDPLVSPLPAGCDLTKGCLGTYHFVIRRVRPQ